MDRYIFPAVFDPCEEGGHCITFPDLPGIVTEGDTLEESLAMAKEALELHLYGMEKDGEEIPLPSDPGKIVPPAGGFVNLIEAAMDVFREKKENKAVNITVTVPAWLKSMAEREKISFSHVLQAGLKGRLGVYEYSKDKHRKNN